MDEQEHDPITQIANLAGGDLRKALDPKKAIAMVQQIRNEAELAGDLEAAERYTQAIGLLSVGAGDAEPPAEEMEAEEEIEMMADEDGKPMAMAAKMMPQVVASGPTSISVTTMAMAMPVMPKMLPWRLVSGLERPRSARMNSTPETR